MPTVDKLRNEIRVSVGRYERQVSSAFTKEALAAICEAVEYDINHDNYPSKAVMRAGILWKLGEMEEPVPTDADRPFRKYELEAIAGGLNDV